LVVFVIYSSEKKLPEDGHKSDRNMCYLYKDYSVINSYIFIGSCWSHSEGSVHGQEIFKTDVKCLATTGIRVTFSMYNIWVMLDPQTKGIPK